MRKLFLYILLLIILLNAFYIDTKKAQKWCNRKNKQENKKEHETTVNNKANNLHNTANNLYKTANNLHKTTNTLNEKEESYHKNNCTEEQPVEINNHLQIENCHIALGKFKINPYKNLKKHWALQKTFSSTCLKCSSCLAVAQYIKDSMEDLFENPEEIDSEIWKNYTNEVLKESCKEGFKNYDLRRYKDQIFVGPTSSITEHVTTTMDGTWTVKLREICTNYINSLDLDLFYDSVLTGCFKIEDFFCRQHGIYRDCINIDLQPAEIPEQHMAISVYVNCEKELSCNKENLNKKN